VPRLDVLTFGPWSKMISGVCLLRPYRAWCSVSFRQACMTLSKNPVSVNKGREAGSNDASTS
jgi:hypothetical protein